MIALGSRLHGAGSGVPQHADRFDDPVSSFGDGGRLAGQDAPRGGLGVSRVVLADVAAADPRSAGDLDHRHVLQLERARQPRAVAAGALDTSSANIAEPLRPANQGTQATTGSRECLSRDESAERVDQHGSVRVPVRIDTEDDFGREA
jgi:hypothetical protein